ncbi:hypothetical protein [Streptomyces litchfieldiae]|nr:hypothetical protein [Streptomyces sp. DSM 44938]
MPENADRLESHEVIWGKSGDLTLHYQEDVLTRSPAAFVTGEDQRRVQVASRILEQRLKPATTEELLEAAEAVRPSPADYMLAILRLGLGAPVDFDQRFFDQVRNAMRDTETGVRYAAVWATSYVEWPQYEPLLVRASEHDPSEKVRGDAAVVLAAYRSLHEEGDGS